MMARRRALMVLAATAVAIAFPVALAGAACHIATFEGDPYTVAEGGGTVTVTVSNNGGAGNGSIDYTTADGTATAGQDYTTKRGTLVFVTGTSEQTFQVTISKDSAGEAAERFTVRLSNPTGCFSTVSESEATVTITDDDSAAQPTPTPTPTPTPVAAADSDSGLSGGAIAGIIAAIVVLGGAAMFLIRRRSGT